MFLPYSEIIKGGKSVLYSNELCVIKINLLGLNLATKTIAVYYINITNIINLFIKQAICINQAILSAINWNKTPNKNPL